MNLVLLISAIIYIQFIKSQVIEINNGLPQRYLNSTFLKNKFSLIPELQSNQSICLNNLRDVLGYLSDYEQAALFLGSQSNNDTDKCINCEVYAKYLPTAIERTLNESTTNLTQSQKKRRISMECLLNFNMPGIEPLVNSSVYETIYSYMYVYGESNKCIVNFLLQLGDILVHRRRFFCSSIKNMTSMAMNDTNGKIIGFKWNQNEAEHLIDSYVRLSNCINADRFAFPQSGRNALATYAMSRSCSRMYETVTSSNGRTLGEIELNPRFLQSNNLTAPAAEGSNNTNLINNLSHNTTETPTNNTNPTTVILAPPANSDLSNNTLNNASSSANVTAETRRENRNESSTIIPANFTNLNNSSNSNATLGNLTNNTPTSSPSIMIALTSPNLLLKYPNLNYIETGLKLNVGNRTSSIFVDNLLNYTAEDQSVIDSIKSLIQTSAVKGSILDTNLAQMLNNTITGMNSYKYNCAPKGHLILLLTMKNNSELINEFEKTSCDKSDYIINISNNTISCSDCDQKILNKSIVMREGVSPSLSYFISTGCSNNIRFNFASWVDYSGVPYISFQMGNVSLDQNCMKKAFSCITNDNNSQFCPQYFMSPECKEKLANNCTNSGLFKIAESTADNRSYSYVLPSECRLETILNLNGSNVTNITPCFELLMSKFFINDYHFFNKMNNSSDILAGAIKPLRYLQSRNVIIPTSEDPTFKNSELNYVRNTLSKSLISIDGINNNSSLSESADIYTKEIKELNKSKNNGVIALPNPIGNNSNYLNYSCLIYILLTFFML